MKKTKLLMPLAAIATIGAVAPVVTLASCSCNKGTTPVDKQYLDKINNELTFTTTLAAPHDALTTLSAKGYDVLNYKLAEEGQEFAFDSSVKKFIIMKGDEVVYSPDGYSMSDKGLVFKFVTTYDKTSAYASYLKDGYASTTLNAETSVDTGNNSFETITYKSTSNADKTVLLRTTTNILTIECSDTIYHMNQANSVTVAGTSETAKCKFCAASTITSLTVQNVELSAETDSSVSVEIGSLTAETGVSADTTFKTELVDHYTGEKITGTEEWEEKEADKECEINQTNISDFLTTWDSTRIASEGAYIRLTGNLSFTDETSKLTVKGQGVILTIDLNGYSMADAETLETYTSRISIEDGATLYIIDSGYTNTSKISLHNHCIQVNGSDSVTTDVSSLYLQGVTIESTTKYSSAAVKLVGISRAEDVQNAKVYVNGASIIASKATGSTKSPYGIYASNNSSVVFNNGYIYSDATCLGGNGLKDYTDITIKEGTFDGAEFCIYHPQQGKLAIQGGTFTAHTCIGVKAGDITISGGNFTANGDGTTYVEDSEVQTSQDGITGEGSVIFADAADSEYGQNINITVTNATMKSTLAHIFRGTGTFGTGHFTGPAYVIFTGGTYYYHQDEPLHLAKTEASSYIFPYKSGGTWTQI